MLNAFNLPHEFVILRWLINEALYLLVDVYFEVLLRFYLLFLLAPSFELWAFDDVQMPLRHLFEKLLLLQDATVFSCCCCPVRLVKDILFEGAEEAKLGDTSLGVDTQVHA